MRKTPTRNTLFYGDNLAILRDHAKTRASISSISIRRSIPTPITICSSRRRTGIRARRRSRHLTITLEPFGRAGF
jgi:hypothetical protein